MPEWQVVRIPVDQHMRDRGLGGHPARDKPPGGQCLNHAIGAGPAGIFGAAGDDDAELGGHDVEPLRHIFANAMQATTAGACQAVRLEDLLNARQVFLQRSTIGGAWFGGVVGSPIFGILFCMDHRRGRFQIFQRQFELVAIEDAASAGK